MQNKLLEYLELADYHKNNKDYKSAIEYYEKFLDIDNSKVSVLTVTADLYSKYNGSESLKRQIELYEQAYKVQPQNRLVLHGLAFGYEKLGLKDKAKKYYEELLANNPTDNDYYNYGGFLISCGDFENGHNYFRHRFNINDINLKYPADEIKKWDLESDISDKTLLVHYEQGFGDTIMYSRFVPELTKYAKKVIFKIQNELFDLVSHSEIFRNIEVINCENEPVYDVNMALIDTPYVTKTKSSNIPYTSKYLEINPEIITDYKNKFLNNRKEFKIGLSLSKNKNANYSGRDIAPVKIYDLLKDIPNIKLYDLQKEENISNDITPLGQTFMNFTDSACAVCNMDLIVTTDNVILNLAGALGKDTIALFNKETNYRWFKTQGNNVGWYEKVTPLQNSKQNDWDLVLNTLKNTVINKLQS